MTMTEPTQEVTEEAPQRWRAVLALIGELSSDFRIFDELTWRDPPLTLRGCAAMDEHEGAGPIGRIDLISLDGNKVIGEGVFDTSEQAIEAMRLVKEGMVKGISIDAAVQEFAVDEEGNAHFTAEILAATVVQMPAFADAVIELIDGEAEASVGEPLEMESPVEEWGHGLSLVASGGTSDIPSEWFNDPRLTKRERLHVEVDGRVWGHVAGLEECHTGSLPGSCVRIPRDMGFDYFNLGGGVVRCQDGTEIPTGPLVISADHAKVRGISWLDARDHYAHSGLAVADVRAGMDSHGIWVAGSLRPGISPDLVHAFRASRPSVDCRQIGGRWQLLALLAVNMPGFPALVAGVDNGRITALVASGSPVGGDCGCGSHEALEAFHGRLEKLEAKYRAECGAAVAMLEVSLGLDPEGIADRLEDELALT